ncbi:aspartyl protease family protein [Phenylobacterium sp.]|jgi:hypothetical protein|uniref:aspartyl protease family protein n=1 Tax=Phenylobacterium sp. TaxID=1871053 RepID=UPI002F3EB071
MLRRPAIPRRQLLWGAGAALVSPAVCAAAGPSAGPNGRLARFPFELLANAIFIPVRVNGKGPVLFALDTGSTNSIVASELAGELEIAGGQAFRSSGAGSDSNMAAMVEQLDFVLPGGLARTVHGNALISMAGLWPLIGRKIYGVAGYNVLQPFVVEIDYARKTLSLYDPQTYRYAGAGTKFPVRMLGRYDPQIDGELVAPGQPPIPVRFTLDTGAGGTIITSPIVDKYNLLSAIGHQIAAPDRGVGGARPTEVWGRPTAFRIGPYAVDKPLVALSRDKYGSLANENLSVNLGGNILRRFTVTIDYVHQWVALEPNRRFSEPFPGDASGLQLSADGDDFRTFVVDGVVPGSPASEAGLETGDVLSALDGRPASAFTLWQVQEALKAAGSVVGLKVRRGDRTFSKPLRLRELI